MHPTRIFKTVDELSTAWDGYKEDLKEQNKEWLNVQYVGRNGEKRTDPLKVPMTLVGFKRYCRNNHGEVGQYFDNKDEDYNDFVAICRAIREEIRECQIIGGMLGVYNPSITQRLNGLTDKSETKTTASIKLLNIDPIADNPDNGTP